MSKEITLPSGATVKLRDPATLLKKDRDKVLEIMSNADNDVMKTVAMVDGLISVIVVEWSLDLIPPAIKFTSLGELTPRDYAALQNEALLAQGYLFPDIETGDANDPKVITANSND